MKNNLSFILLKELVLFRLFLRLMTIFFFVFIAFACNQKKEDQYQFIGWVNPFIGTAPLLDTNIIGYTPPQGWRVWAGLNFPGASLPNAMVQLSPMTKWGSGAGYEYEDTVIYGFTHTNLGHWNLCHIPVLPVTGTVQQISSQFSHDQEKAMPGYYQVLLKDFNIVAELTTTLRCGFHRYKFPKDSDKKVVFNLSRSNERVREWNFEQTRDNAVSGIQITGRNTRVFFFAEFNHEISQIEQTSDYSIVNLHAKKGDLVEMKIGLSFVSEKNAKENLEAEIGNKSFDQVKNEAFDIWEDLLGRIEVNGGTKKQKELFYSGIYHSSLWPALRSDVNGEYLDARGDIVTSDYNYYTRPALWDTYRNKLVLLGMLSPGVTSDVIKSLIETGEKTGYIPGYFHGDFAAVFITGSFLRGIDDFDIEKAYQLLLKSATVEEGPRPHIKVYMEKGYVPEWHVENPRVETVATAGVTKTLEYAYCDYALSLLAKHFNDTSVYRIMIERTRNYRNVFDKTTRFMRGRLEDGSWIEKFNPDFTYYEYMYRESNAWNTTFFVPHDVDGLIELFDGNENFENKLDFLFYTPTNRNYRARNSSGFLGKYCHGNQPPHNFPYLYYWVGKQEKSQQILDSLMGFYYGVGEHDLAYVGMDDAGELSSWYVYNAMGFYPFSPVDPEYIITVPLFDEVKFKIPGYNDFKILREGTGNKINRLILNGKQLNDFWLTHNQIKEGGELIICAAD